MNNIFRNDVETNGFINRDHNIGALYIVPSTLIREIYTVGVHRSSQLIVTFTELAVITWITHLPLELLSRSEEHTSELQSRENLVCRLLLEKKNKNTA